MKWYIAYMTETGAAKKGPYKSYAAAKKDYSKVKSFYKAIIKTAQ